MGSLEKRTAFGIEYIEFKKTFSGYYKKDIVFFRKKWNKKPKGKWIPSKFSTENDFIKAMGDSYKTSAIWDKIQKQQKEQIQKQIPYILKLENIDSEIRSLESKMVGGKIDSLTGLQKKKYFNLLKERKGINIL